MTALLLLAPGTPMLFQGQEFAAVAPVPLLRRPQAGAGEAGPGGPGRVPGAVPVARRPRDAGRLRRPGTTGDVRAVQARLRRAPAHSGLYQLTKDLLKLRREDPAFKAQRRGGVDGAVLGDQAFVLRFFVDDGIDRLLVVNFGRDQHLAVCPEPLLAPPLGTEWRVE